MKAFGRFLFLVLFLSGLVRADPTVLKLNDGSVIKGAVTPPSPTATEVVVSTDYGVIRVPVAKISPESLKAAGIGQQATTAQYEVRIAQLEAKIKDLEAENAKLRRAQTAGQPSAEVNPSPAARTPPTARI